METQNHSLNSLFEQLGLANSDDAIESFLQINRPIERNKALYEAKLWTPAQAEFLKQSIKDDADWSIVVDRLDALLR